MIFQTNIDFTIPIVKSIIDWCKTIWSIMSRTVMKRIPCLVIWVTTIAIVIIVVLLKRILRVFHIANNLRWLYFVLFMWRIHFLKRRWILLLSVYATFFIPTILNSLVITCTVWKRSFARYRQILLRISQFLRTCWVFQSSIIVQPNFWYKNQSLFAKIILKNLTPLNSIQRVFNKHFFNQLLEYWRNRGILWNFQFLVLDSCY